MNKYKIIFNIVDNSIIFIPRHYNYKGALQAKFYTLRVEVKTKLTSAKSALLRINSNLESIRSNLDPNKTLKSKLNRLLKKVSYPKEYIPLYNKSKGLDIY